MAQEKIKLNNIEVKQPLGDMGYAFETTYSEDTTRVQSGLLHSNPLFTVERLSYKAKNVSLAEMSTILQIVAKGTNFTLHYFSPYYGQWRDAPFYVGQGSLVIGRLTENGETYESLEFNMVGVNPI